MSKIVCLINCSLPSLHPYGTPAADLANDMQFCLKSAKKASFRDTLMGRHSGKSLSLSQHLGSMTVPGTARSSHAFYNSVLNVEIVLHFVSPVNVMS